MNLGTDEKILLVSLNLKGTEIKKLGLYVNTADKKKDRGKFFK